MICPNCGREGTGKFCTACGTRLNPPAETQLPQEPQEPLWEAPAQSPAPPLAEADSAAPESDIQPASPRWNPQPPRDDRSSGSQTPFYDDSYRPSAAPAYADDRPVSRRQTSPALALVRKLAGGPVYFLAMLAYTVSMVLNLVVNVRNLSLLSQYKDLARSSAEWRGQYIGTLVGVVVLGVILVLTLCALWPYFFRARGNKPLPTGGLTYIKTMAILGIVLICLAFALGLVAVIVALGSGGLSELEARYQELLRQMNLRSPMPVSTMMNGLLAVTLIIYVAVPVLVVIYCGKLIKTVNTMKRTLVTGIADDRVSAFVAVVCILTAAVVAISGAISLAQGQTIQGCMGLLSTVSQLCFGILLLQYRKKMRMLGVYDGQRVATPL